MFEVQRVRHETFTCGENWLDSWPRLLELSYFLQRSLTGHKWGGVMGAWTRILFIAAFGISISLSAKSSDDWYKIPPEDFQSFIQNFPQPGSEPYQQDYETLLKLQSTRSQEECQLGRYLKWPNFASLFAKDKPEYLDDHLLPVDFDDLLSKSEIEKYKPLMNRVLRFSSKVTRHYKTLYARDRPSRINSHIKPCAEVPEGKKSYPSSHTAKGALLGCLFSEKFKTLGNHERAEKFLEYGEYMGDLRAIIGVHHPSDVVAGKSIGYAICDRLLRDESFHKAFKAL